ncbi:NAC domain containing protein 82 [Euphorbia peplus]|nr:NAC domain containing protein 82 [Euphorbia peplus]
MGNKGLPPGFRFHPTDVELVKYYLKRKVLGKKLHFEAIAELDIYKHAPWDLRDKSLLRTGDLKWYFFCPREKKYSSGSRMNRATDLGYWKTTGKDRPVQYRNENVGMIKTLVFHRGKAPKGDRTDWVMYEYRLEDSDLSKKGVPQDSYVLCSVFEKDGPGPRNGAQYGAPFNEEEWDDDDVGEVNGVDVVSCAIMAAALRPTNQSHAVALPSTTSNSVAEVPDNQVVVASSDPLRDSDEDFDALLANFSEDIPYIYNEVDTLNSSEMVNNLDHVRNKDPSGFDIFEDLGDLGNLAGYNEHKDGTLAFHDFNYTMGETSGSGNGQFLELMDFEVPLNCSSVASGYDEVFQSDLHHNVIHSSPGELLSGISELEKGNVFVENSNQEFTNTSDVFSEQTSEMGTEETRNPIGRGEEEKRNSSSILQYQMGVKRRNCRDFLSSEGSSIHVKAEVIRLTTPSRCTKDAVSKMLEESLIIVYGYATYKGGVLKISYIQYYFFLLILNCEEEIDAIILSF